MNPDKELTRIRLSRWLNEKFRDEIEVKSQYDKEVFSLIMALIESNGRPLHDDNDNRTIKKQLDEIQATVDGIHDSILVDEQFDELMAAIGNRRQHEPTDEAVLREELKSFMAKNKLTIQDVAGRIKKNPRTVWEFLSDRVKSHDRTLYGIKELLGRE